MKVALLAWLISGSAAFAQSAPLTSPLPEPRPSQSEPIRVATIGELCDDPRLQGRIAPEITAVREGCGIEAPVQLTSVSGVSLSSAATVNCTLASTLADWLEFDVHPLFAQRPALTGLAGISGYVCRGIAGGDRLSEHATGNAMDIAAFRLGDDSRISVLDGWDDPEDGPLLRDLFDTACARFGTVLGPGANDAHADHFHLDMAPRRNAYCR